MNKKTYTFLMVSNRRGTTSRVVLDAVWLKASLVVFLLLAVVSVAGVVDYVGLLVQSVENKRLRAENTQLKAQFQVVEGKVDALESGLDRVKSWGKKLRMITDVESEDRTTQLIMGANPKYGEPVHELDQPLDQRQPASHMAHEDDVFFEETPLDEVGGELSRSPTNRDYATLSIRIDRALKESALSEQGVFDLWNTLSERQSLMNATPSIRPARGWFTSRFGYRISPFTGRPAMHAGLDIAAAPGSPVYAPADGVVSYAGYDSGYGKLVSIDHGYGVTSRFGHNSQIFVTVGQKVSRRDVISSVGNTGRSTGPHVHYEVRVNGVPVDPINYILEY